MAAKWTRVFETFRGHTRLEESAEELGILPAHMAGHLVYLWLWAMNNTENGMISSRTPKQIALAGGWKDDADKFTETIMRHWVVDFKLRGWDEHEGKIFVERKYERDRKANKPVSAGSTAEVQRNSEGKPLISKDVKDSKVFRGVPPEVQRKQPEPLKAVVASPQPSNDIAPRLPVYTYRCIANTTLVKLKVNYDERDIREADKRLVERTDVIKTYPEAYCIPVVEECRNERMAEEKVEAQHQYELDWTANHLAEQRKKEAEFNALRAERKRKREEAEAIAATEQGV